MKAQSFTAEDWEILYRHLMAHFSPLEYPMVRYRLRLFQRKPDIHMRGEVLHPLRQALLQPYKNIPKLLTTRNLMKKAVYRFRLEVGK